MSEWDRQPGEPALWFGRFDRLYRPLGTERSLLAAYNAWRTEVGKGATTSVANAWLLRSKEWRWRERAEAWDAIERLERLAAEKTAAKKRRDDRLALLQGVKASLSKRLLAMKPDEWDIKQVLTALDLVFEQERLEDGSPTAVLEHRGPADAGGAIMVKFVGNVDPDRLRLPDIINKEGE